MFNKKAIFCVLLAMMLSSCVHNAASYVAKGNKLFAQGKYEDAELQYRNAINKDPRYAEAYYRMGLLLLRRTQFSAAYDSLKHAVELDPGFSEASVQLGDLGWFIYNVQNHPTAGIYNDISQQSQKLLAANRKDFDGLRFKAYIAMADKRVDDALGLLASANSIRPLSSDVIMPMTHLLIQEGDAARAETLLRQLSQKNPSYGPAYETLYALCISQKRTEDAEAVLRLQVEKNPKQASALIELADHYARQHNTAAMNATLQRLQDARGSISGAGMALGDFYARHQDPDAALRVYQEAIRYDAKNEIAYRKRIVLTLTDQGKNAEAQAELAKILKREPRDSEALLMKANFEVNSGQKGKISDAAGLYKGLAAEQPNNLRLRFFYARALLAEGDERAARAELSDTVRRHPRTIGPRLALADLSLREGKDAEAFGLVSVIVDQDPSSDPARLLRAIAEEGLGQRQAARADLDKVLRDHPDNEDAQLHLALLDLAEKHYTEATSVFTKYYKPGQKDLRPLEGLIRAYASQGQFDKAVATLSEEVKQSPRSYPVRGMLASAAIRANRADVAEEQYRALVAQGQDSASLELQWGELLQVKGNAQDAIERYRKSIALNPRNSAAATMLGHELEITGHETEAIASYRDALKSDPNNILALNNLAFALAETGQDLDGALRMALNAQRLTKDNLAVADTLGWVYLKKGLTGSALQVFQNNVRRDPKNASYHYHLGAALLASGDKLKAKEELIKALEISPSNADGPNIRRLLAKIG